MDHARVATLLEQVGLASSADARPATLSGGMRQRAALARTLYEDRPIVLMDEPFSALDTLTRTRIQTLAATLLAGRTVVLITHDPLEACRLSHRLLVLSAADGRSTTAITSPARLRARGCARAVERPGGAAAAADEGPLMTGRLWRGGMVFCGLMLLWGWPAAAAFRTFFYPPGGGRRGAVGQSRLSRLAHADYPQRDPQRHGAGGGARRHAGAGHDPLPRLQRWLMPLVLTSRAIPVFALAPLLVLWLGFGMSAKVAMAVLVIFFPVTSAFFDGLRRVNHEYLDLARSMNASFGAQLRHVRLMAALPALGSGLRMAAAVAPSAPLSANGSAPPRAGLRHAQCQRAAANRYLLRRAVYFSTADPLPVAGGRHPAAPADRLVAGIIMK